MFFVIDLLLPNTEKYAPIMYYNIEKKDVSDYGDKYCHQHHINDLCTLLFYLIERTDLLTTKMKNEPNDQ